jgi:acetyl esterase/lipase
MSESILELAPPKADKRIAYGVGPLQFAELRYPVGQGPFPLVINIHGGFWRARYNLIHAGHFCAGLTKSGFLTCNIEYRRAGNPGGGWPGTFEDVRNAYAYIRRCARELNADTGRFLVMGHSAGGQLALCLAGHEPSITRAVSLSGVLDLQRAYELHLSRDAVVEFLGGTPERVPEHYREASPMDLKIAARQAIITGDADHTVPSELSQNYAKKKKAAGESVELIQIPGASHFEAMDPRTGAFETVRNTVQNLLA